MRWRVAFPVGWYAKERAAERIARLAGQSLDLVTFWQESGKLWRGRPSRLAPCWFTFDPASLLVTSHYDHDLVPHATGVARARVLRGRLSRWPMSLAPRWGLDPARGDAATPAAAPAGGSTCSRLAPIRSC